MDRLAAHLDRAWDLVGRGDLGGAMRSAERSLELEPDAPEVHNLIGYIHALEGRADEAVEAYAKALELDESFVEAMLNSAEVMLHPLADYEGALRMIDDALDWVDGDEEQTDARLLQLDVLFAKGDEDGARRVALLLPAEPLGTTHLDTGIGRVLFDLGEVERAAPFLERAASASDASADTLYYHGLLLARRDDARGAAVAFLRARDADLRGPPPRAPMSTEAFESRVAAALAALAEPLSSVVAGALVVVCDLPGAEVVAEGVDPRAPVLLDDLTPPGAEACRAGRVFVYQRNVERGAAGLEAVERAIRDAIAEEIRFTFPGIDGNGAAAATPDAEEPASARS